MNGHSTLTPSTKRIWLTACADMTPLSVAVVPWGILCGSLGIQAGLTPLQAQAMSLFVFAGAAQLSGITMMGIGAPISTLFSTTFVISARHLLYSVNMRTHIRTLSLKWRLALGFLLTDEMYVLSAAHTQKQGAFCRYYALFSGAFFYLCWNLATLVGVLGGTHFDNIEDLGLEFAIAATFIALVIPTIKDMAVLCSVIVSAVSVILLTVIGFSNALIAGALIGMLAGFLWETINPSHQDEKEKESGNA
ncbi:AzlC family ABC transporter permease [Enterovibrio sp. ZSDZ35]|uniref:AzlC family ABC transporter permease n=1 Tax=Enterovibrio qingdaonensis TaxID=2899818 RepID=A0ABT5QQE3_9GAMM|nr:AzlC family ABC transporter permease [Enterovibrio sp. ZSDZ35]MDD1783200.1 AzlC family ABC transporter permease [Enterovibrio sp. ZSDZ35]